MVPDYRKRNIMIEIGKLIVFLLFTLLLSSCDDKKLVSPVSPKAVIAVEARTAEFTSNATLSGSVAARTETQLSFRVSGRIIERNVEVGSHVKAGEILARIDPAQQQADVDVAKAGLAAAEAQLRQATLALKRQKELLATQITSKANYDQAVAALRTAEGSTDAARAVLASAKDTLGFTYLKADADGIITARIAEVGQVQQAAQTVFTLAHEGKRDAVFNVFESLFLNNESKDSIQVSLLSDPSVTISATVREVSPTIDSSTGTIRVKVDLGEQGSIMPLGAIVTGRFSYQSKQVILLPWSAMASIDGNPAVWLIDPQTNKVSLQKIQVSDYETGLFAVTGGLKDGDLVVSDGGKLIRMGQQVSILRKEAI
jgi:RND family efflux transporter MFP subunit